LKRFILIQVNINLCNKFPIKIWFILNWFILEIALPQNRWVDLGDRV